MTPAPTRPASPAGRPDALDPQALDPQALDPQALDPNALGRVVVAKLDELGAISDEANALTRLTLSPAHARAVALVRGWMEEAGLATRLDPTGTLHGRLEGARPGLPALLLGSHLDTVRDAGRFDGALGVVAAIQALAALEAGGHRAADRPFAVEIAAFGDEEGVRFPTTLTGSRAAAGRLDPAALAEADEAGLTRADALRAFGCDPDAWADTGWRPEALLAYAEIHIEQGPVLEAEGLPLGIVTAIAGTTRGRATVDGVAGHAGTVPMAMRRDALAAAAEMVLAVETTARGTPNLLATVGRLLTPGGAVNTVPGQVAFSIDVRSEDDAVRRNGAARIEARLREIAALRGVGLAVEFAYDMAAAPCDPALQTVWADALAELGLEVRRLPSGAGHDAMAFRGVLPVSMLFVRCRGGVSHRPDEFASAADIGLATAALARFVAGFDPQRLPTRF